MVNYEKPELVEVSDFVETVNLASGNSGDGNSSTHCRWKGHNGGGHSVLTVDAISNAGCFTNNVRGKIYYHGTKKIRLAEDNPTDGKNVDSVAFDGSVIEFTAHRDSNGNGNESSELSPGAFQFSTDGVNWGSYTGGSGDCGSYEFCDDVFTAVVTFF